MSTRSNSSLNGNIREYLLPTKNSRHKNTELGEVSAVVETMAGDEAEAPVLTEHQQTMAILGKLTEAITSMTIANTNNMQQPGPAVQPSRSYQKLEDCPVKKKTVSLESWLREVELWNECNKVEEDSYGKKFQKFITSIRNSEEGEEINAVANSEFVENINFERSKSDTVQKMIDILKTKLGSTDFEKATEAWLTFVNIKQKDEESIKEFCTRFTQAETMLRNTGNPMKESALAIHLLSRTNLNDVSKENVMTKVNTEKKEDLYKNMMKAIKEIKVLAVGGRQDDPNRTFYSENRLSRSQSRGNYGNDSRPWNRSKSREGRYKSGERRRDQSRSSSKQRFSDSGQFDRSSSKQRQAFGGRQDRSSSRPRPGQREGREYWRNYREQQNEGDS